MQTDPLAELMSSWNPYVYTFNNPLVYSDPTGMAPFDPSANQEGEKSVSNSKFEWMNQGKIENEKPFWQKEGLDFRPGVIGNGGDPVKKGENITLENGKTAIASTNEVVVSAKRIKKGVSTLDQVVANNCNCSMNLLPIAASTFTAYNAIGTTGIRLVEGSWEALKKGNKSFNVAGSRVLNGFAITSVGISTYDYGTNHLMKGGSIWSPESLLLTGDLIISKIASKDARTGLILTGAWEAGKGLGRYKNYLEIKYSPGGLDGLISTKE